MGVRHLKDLREFMKENASKVFSRTELRDELKQNYPTILDNIDYLMKIEKVIQESPTDHKKIQWIGEDTNGELPTEESTQA